ncbi:MraY family glycosyltransferase [Alicyclobacillus mengziensis]|uniref:Undecaprenyl/decaprenyl-phosphate alpha-N-acetylglucosaminyl 1-phosphate transferase n=1 Tax=Alicyclobacillus mengziensis TaxID=2931921 RepID=A0A9X7W1Y9_9BACL|nr:MraY family glycosyltransferase [Alicyclobacillus mengziensis]QSO48997.1 undecaprenyl/decaprenyl-phosphate alpha-N-acetylglucosaminyl 1-phosphate transferase [Alicyclobacillus mengziensis]
MLILYSCLTALAISIILVPYIRRLAIKWNFVDLPNPRKVHKEPLPLLGGMAILVGFVISSTIFSFIDKPVPSVYYGLMGGTFLLYSVGMIDDYYKTRRRDFSAGIRIIAQTAAAILVIWSGGTVHTLTVPFGGGHYILLPRAIAWILTVTWIVGVINVYNFLDGLDGLAAGIGTISSLTMVFFAWKTGDLQSAIWAAALAGGAMGFLRYNFFPARIIMGDAGSTMLGFVLASVAAVGAFKSATVVSIVVPVLALGVPIFDAIRVVIGRAIHGQPIYRADQTHGHHWLLRAGFSQVQTVTLLYIVSVCFSLASVIVVLMH